MKEELLRRLKRNAREMRHTPTRTEDRLWSWLRDRRCSGFKFKRQVPLGPYIADFYCAELKLIIELDGAHHETPWMSEYDGVRTRALEEHGYRVLRIPNQLLIRDSLLVGEQIMAVIAEISGEPLIRPSGKDLGKILLPVRGEGAEGG